jgi:hypothetical protein
MSIYSTLSNIFSSIFSRTTKVINNMRKSAMTETYVLNSCEKIDTEKARAIYNNTENNYKLSAGMVRPIINADVAFIGEPRFFSENEDLNELLKELNKKTVGFYQSAHRVVLREGDIYIWIQWDDKEQDVKWVGLPDDKLKEIIRNPITNEIIQYVFEWNVDYKDKTLQDKQLTINILIDTEVIVYKYTGDVPSGYGNEVVPNVLKELPIVQLSNEREDFEVKGHSEITHVEPYLKAYHDVVMMALQAQKNNSAPKLKIKTTDVANFIDINWGSGTYTKLINGELPEGISVKNLDLLVMKDNDDAEYLNISSISGDAKGLLELLFYLIVETSETIEVVFGANLGTSLASVESQLPVYVKKIEKKQKMFQQSWMKVVELTFKMKGFVNIELFEDEIRVIWDIVDFEAAREKALTLQRKVSTFALALKSNILSFEEVHDESKEIFENVIKDFDEHLEKVKDTAMLTQRFIEDAESQAIEAEGERLE